MALFTSNITYDNASLAKKMRSRTLQAIEQYPEVQYILKDIEELTWSGKFEGEWDLKYETRDNRTEAICTYFQLQGFDIIYVRPARDRPKEPGTLYLDWRGESKININEYIRGGE